MSPRPPKPTLVTLTDGRGHRIYKGMDGWGVHVYHVCDRDKDAALIRAYTENVGHPPSNKGASEQWRYNPRSPKYRGRALELAS